MTEDRPNRLVIFNIHQHTIIDVDDVINGISRQKPSRMQTENRV